MRRRAFTMIELLVTIRTIRGMEFPDPDTELRWVVPPRSDFPLLSLDLLEDALADWYDQEAWDD